MGPRRHLTWILALSFWTALGSACGLQIWIGMLDHHHSLVRLVAYQVLIWNAWFALTPLIGWLARRFPLVPPTARAIAVHAVAALAIAPIHSVWWAMLLIVVRPYDAMGTREFAVAFRGVALSGLVQQVSLYGVVLIAHHAALYYRKYRERERLAARLEASLAEARLHALELQLQPHFLFNTLNSISALVRTARQREAVTMIAGLSDLLRYSLDHAGEQRVSLATELAIIERYLEIERLRFPDRMAFEIDAPAEIRRAAVPTLLLQPLVENAIRHGIARSAGAGRVEIRARRDGAALCIEVFNTGTLAAGHRAGVGLRNTLDRLRHLYRADQRFELRAGDGGVVAAVRLPWSEPAGGAS
ncbi:MAG TPA: histidine kinase [Kofleriaceae bacterium]|nr:histidine kinase [Kofleriaceae bacterium]